MSGTRDRNLPANLKLRRPGPAYNQEEMAQAFRLIEQHYHLQLIPGTTVTTEEPPEEPPDAEFPMVGLGALYDCDLDVTTTTRASSWVDGYSFVGPDQAYEAATLILDQSGNGNTLNPDGTFGGWIDTEDGVNGHYTMKCPGGGNAYPMSSVVSASQVVTEATIFCVARVAHSGGMSDQEFSMRGVFSVGSSPTFNIGGVEFAGPSNYGFVGNWSGATIDDGTFDIVVVTWDGTSLKAYRNGYSMANLGGVIPTLAAPRTIIATDSGNEQVEWTTWGWWSRALAGSEIKTIFTLMGAKYGIPVPL